MRSYAAGDLRALGSTGLNVSPIGLGTVKFGRNTGVRYPSHFEIPDDRALTALLDRAEALGINLIDTAPAYGTSETRLGKLLAGRAHSFLISTKVGERFIDGESSFDFSDHGVRRSVHSSLRSLQLDYLDLVMIHCSDDDLDDLTRTDAVSSLSELKQAGVIGATGASVKTLEAGRVAIAELDVVMITYHIDDTSMAALISEAQQKGKGVLVKKGLASGHAADPAAALRFALAPPAISAVIVGTINPDHLSQNVAASLG